MAHDGLHQGRTDIRIRKQGSGGMAAAVGCQAARPGPLKGRVINRIEIVLVDANQLFSGRVRHEGLQYRHKLLGKDDGLFLPGFGLQAGSYAIQGFFARYIKGIQGDYNNVVGLPVARLYQELKRVWNCN